MTNAERRLYQEVACEFRHRTGTPEFTALEATRWAIRNGRLDASPGAVEQYHRDRMAAAMRDETIDDGHGGRVRRWHSVRREDHDGDGNPVQRDLWNRIDEAPLDFLRESIRQRCEGVNHDIAGIRRDAAVMNATRFVPAGEPPIVVCFDFDSPLSDDEAS